LSGTATELVQRCAYVLADEFDALVDAFVPAIIKLTGRANKVFVTRCMSCMDTILSACSPVRMLPRFLEMLSHPNKNVRLGGVTFIGKLIEHADPSSLAEHLPTVGEALGLGLHDAAAEVRVLSSKAFQSFKQSFSEQADL